MDNSKNIVSDFELLLQKQIFKKRSVIYNKVLNTNEQTLKPQDVIETVYSQIKAIHLADSAKSVKSGSKVLKTGKISNFLPVNKVPVYASDMQEVLRNPNKFETQCVSDTQLINIIDGAEAIDTNTGMTQEFDTTFTHIEDRNIDNSVHAQLIENSPNCLNDIARKDEEIFVLENMANVIKSSQSKKEIITTINDIESIFASDHNVSEKPQAEKNNAIQIEHDLTLDINSQLSKTDTEDTITFLQNVPNTQEANSESTNTLNTEELNIGTGQGTQRSPSPVLNMQPTKRKFEMPSPLVVSLESFENFENIAIPVIEKNTDFETAKHLINSQILGRELCLNTNTDVMFNIERNYSPVLDFKCDELQINSQDLKTSPIKNILDKIVLLQDNKNDTEKRSDSLKDEILFSSDEENDYVHKGLKDLPLTCALETSFYDQTGVLEKTMYVGFQTASNKSIQISRNSFDKAHSILENSSRNVEEFSLSELVEKCDTINSKHEKCTQSPEMTVHLNETVKTIADSKVKNVCDHTNKYPFDKQDFNGFKTASNKEIKVSDKALERCQNVFKDIDLHKNIDAIEISVTSHSTAEREIYLDAKENEALNVKFVKENTVDGKINDELLLQEFENIDMSLEIKDNYNKVKKDIVFEGFKTANNKNIKISKEALSKTKKVFQDIDEELNERKNMMDTVEIPMVSSTLGSFVLENAKDLKTANNHNSDISTQAFAKTKNIFQDIEIDKKLDIEDMNRLSSKTEFVGFKTANNKNIKISEEALSKTRNIFMDIGKDKINDIKVINQRSTNKDAFLGFKTANNKDIKISDVAMSKTKNIFKDLDKELPKIESIKDINEIPTSKHVFVGFKTANNTNIKISADGLSKSKNLFRDIDKEITTKSKNDEGMHTFSSNSKKFKMAINKNDKIFQQTKDTKLFQKIDIDDGISYFEVQNTNEKIVFDGFKTANNKDINMSTETLLRSKKVFSDLENHNGEKLRDGEDSKHKSPVFKGFQTASKKPVTVSADALAGSKIIFQDIEANNESMPEKILMRKSNIGFKGFQVDKKMAVEGNKEASKELCYNFINNEMENCRSSFVGFKTASNKNVNISDEALNKCKKFFEDFADQSVIARNPLKSEIHEQNEYTFKGFQTTNKKEVKISKRALEKTKNLFADLGNISTPEETKGSFGGFQTANSKKVTVSDQALEKSRQLFHEIYSENDINIVNKDMESDRKNQITEKNDARGLKSNVLDFQISKNKQVEVSKNSFKKSEMIFAQNDVSDTKKQSLMLETNGDDSKDLKSKECYINIDDSILNTQILNNFEENLCTEDFKDTARPNKRSGSPILSCPRAKKRKKFETPYKLNPKTILDFNKDIAAIKKPVNLIIFKEDYKKNKNITLEDLANVDNDKTKNVDPYILNFNLDNLLSFEFSEARNDLKEGMVTIKEIKHLFSEATDKKLIPEGWMDIHLKLILWKLISYEIRFPSTLGMVCTVRNVIDQLKYRYDKELYNAERPILRKILEKDDISTKSMVLCVAGIYVDDVSVTSVAKMSNIELLLTDGWYFVKATIDNMLSKLVYDGKIVVGSKIMTCGAELMNCEQGVAPWEDTSSVRLNISGNSTRLARWSARLGLRPGAILARLPTVRADGGKVCRLRTRVVRVYPRLYVEKFHDGSTVTRSERLEHQYQMKYEAEREAMIEKIYEEVEKEFSDQESQESDGALDASNKRCCSDSGSQIAKLMKTSKDPMEFRAQLTSTQVQLLQEHVSKQRDRYLQAIQDKVRERLRPRNVVTLARGRIADVKREGDRFTVTKGMLSIWKPNDEVLDIFKENSWIEVTNVVPTAFRNSEIQLSAGRQSVFRPVKCSEEEVFKPNLESFKRKCYEVKDLSQNPSMTTDYNEIDTIGIIFSIDPTNREFESNKNQFQNVYLADIDKNIICVNFWGGIKKFGYENVLDTGQVIYCGNLQKRAGNTRKNIPQYRATEFSLFTKTPKNERASAMVDELNKKMFGLDRRKFCEDCVAVKQNYAVIKCFIDSEKVSPYGFNRSAYNLSKNKMFIESPIGLKVDRGKPDEFSLTGLDFESTFKQQDTQELSPKTLLRKKKVNDKIAKLKQYGEPPPLSPISIINKSKNAVNSYKSPLLSKNDKVAIPNKISNVTSGNNTENIATPSKIPDECVKIDSAGSGPLLSSPIISMNRTLVKRSSVNPVKLNFSENAAIYENVDNSVDHFAEEFDGSPPLSLD